jgi:hypothetical protein
MVTPGRISFSRVSRVSDVSEAQWIRSFALAPRRLSDGAWVWLRPYEWRWQRPEGILPDAINPPRVFSRKPRAQQLAASTR